jgi:hypothetical protein
MFGQSILARFGVSKFLTAVGVDEDTAKWIGRGVGFAVMIATFDAVGGVAEAAGAAADAAGAAADVATSAAGDIAASAADGAISLAADHSDIVADTIGHATVAGVDHMDAVSGSVADHAAGFLPEAADIDVTTPSETNLDFDHEEARHGHYGGTAGNDPDSSHAGHSDAAGLAGIALPASVLGYRAAGLAADRSNAPSPIKILFLSADPSNAARLRLGEESREIREKLQLGKCRNKFEFHERNSVRPADISQSLLDIVPGIVHFSGHGTEEGALCCEDAAGRMRFIQPADLADLFRQFAATVRCIILSDCFSVIQARAIVEHIEYVIGMSREIGDRAAIAFAVGFYQALAAGRTIPEAYEMGRIQIGLQGIPGKSTPVLLKRK